MNSEDMRENLQPYVKIEGDCTQVPIANGLFLPICDEDKEEERFK